MDNLLSEEFEKCVISHPGQEFKGITVKPLNRETLDKIKTENIRAFSIALEGAQGAPGKRVIITNDFEIYTGNVLDGSMDEEEVKRLKTKLSWDGFALRNMGGGNQLFIKESDYIWFDAKIDLADPMLSGYPVITRKDYWVNIILYRIALDNSYKSRYEELDKNGVVEENGIHRIQKQKRVSN